ncbi:MAG: hypothetical protein A3I39_02800 [Candidatus Yanofskybacteria bacterium RIFCSPLOWO2_02_FULL_47_9b]|uniref:Uncharacterized protein n=1 Tax=Candidatus Yanofskybacteria bacterium RIFCSPLOWO2_02_FULL_47_9b TaxID=1802708 RepID=A0A1F8HA65_9BACT|nr:MAG: hypothetical protein A3I39_02800 [Candidatus Yanofskybacteria bacterium RIFCSPLOWO2_02_FULL_47_9b]
MILPFDPFEVMEDKGIEAAANLWQKHEFIETLRNLRRAIGLLSENGVLIMTRTKIRNLPSILTDHRSILSTKDFESTEIREIDEMVQDILNGDRFSGLLASTDFVSELLLVINERIRVFTRKSRPKSS